MNKTNDCANKNVIQEKRYHTKFEWPDRLAFELYMFIMLTEVLLPTAC